MDRPDSFIEQDDELASNAALFRARLFIVCIVLLGLLLLGSSHIAWRANVQQQELARIDEETLSLLRNTHAVRVLALEALRGERGYLLTRDATYLEPFHDAERRLPEVLDNLQGHHDDSRSLVLQLKDDTQSYMMDLRTVLALARAGWEDDALNLVRTGHASASIDRINADVKEILDRERAHLGVVKAKTRAVNDVLMTYLAVMAVAGICLLVLACASVIALRRSVARERAYRRELSLLARTDELTGMTNRREFLAGLDHAIAASRGHGTLLSFVIFDIDHFKRVNDAFGHAAGDNVIRQVARVAMANMRAGDMVGRIGGEEFGIIMPRASELEAAVLCEHLRIAMQAEAIDVGHDLRIPVTVSFGVAELGPLENATKLMERADRALYAAKRGGRDQVSLAA